MTTDSGKSFLKMENLDGPFVPNPASLDGVPDLCMLTHLGELNVLHNLKCRYEKKDVYTSTTAKVIVAMNPYEAMPENYTEARMKAYQDQASNLEGLADKNSLPPHLFWVANSAFGNLVRMNANQSIIVCGESGSGKTESAKYMMRFLAFTTTATSVDPSEFAEADAIGQQVLDANPILESYGNAKTLINNNSSRFGKFTKMLFLEGKVKGKKKLVGAGIDSYLLEKSRVVYQDQGERNYHIFYQLTHCRDQHPELKLKAPEQHKFSGQSNCTQLEDLRYKDKNEVDKKWHEELEEAWTVLKIPKEHKDQTYAVAASILHLGDVKFKDKSGEGSDIENPEVVNIVADLLGVDVALLTKRLEIRTLLLPGGQLLDKPLNEPDAEFNRDSLCRNIYNGLFRWVVYRINQVSFPSTGTVVPTYIGILDVFGFEIFANNSFEQFCINFANERLQQYFNEHVLMAEQILYQREALLWNPIALPDNQDCIDLFTRKPFGIYAILDSTCIQPKGDAQVFTTNLFKQFKYHPKLRKTETREGVAGKSKEAINGFTVKHYAGQVLYNAQEFLIKNSDSSEFDTIELMWSSKKEVIKNVLMMRPDGTLDTKVPERSAKRSFLSTGSVFADQLGSLMGELKKTAPYFVRCVKPNPQKKPRHFVGEFVRPQLRCGGLIEALRIIKLGFPTRCKYDRVTELFVSILKDAPITNLNSRDFTEAMCAVVGDAKLKPSRDEFQMGLTMIFFRPGKQAFLTDILEKDPASISAAQVEKVREYLTKKRWVRAAGLAKGWIRTNGYISTIRFSKAATAMSIFYRVFGRALTKARSTLNGKQEEEEAKKRAQQLEFQLAMKAKEDLVLMKQKEEENKRLLEEEKVRIAQVVAEKEKELQAQKDKTKEQANKYKDLQNEKSEYTKKYVEVLKRTNEERAKFDSQIKAAESKATTAEMQAQSANNAAASAEAEAEKMRKEIADTKASLGAGKDEYERKIREQDARISDLERQIRLNEEGRKDDRDAVARQIREKDTTIEGLQRQLKLLEEGRASDKKDYERRLADKTKALADQTSQRQAAESSAKKTHEESEDEAAKLRSEVEKVRQELAAEKAKLEGQIAGLEAEQAAKQAELQRISDTVLKEKEEEMEKMREEVKKARAESHKARAAAHEEIEAARQANKKANQTLEDDYTAKIEALTLARADLREVSRDRDILKEKLDKKIIEVKAEVAREHKREHQAQMNELQEKLDKQIRDLKDDVRALEQQLEVAKKWRTNGAKRA
eukprot:gb/GEZN01000540.1/.p1 GENE.gb/GEZN01000540.1/~~gb/GEZN01000540.1/.p1  ORF type:complete len:1260 (-),score=321.89 gb/GEZN01000540.1/:281-4060(-)